MTQIQTLLERLRERGFSVHLGDGRVQIRGENIPDEETRVLIHELRTRREEIRALLVAPTCWNCGALMAETTDIYGRSWWKCWECAVTV